MCAESYHDRLKIAFTINSMYNEHERLVPAYETNPSVAGTFQENAMEILLNPNVAYLILTFTLVMTVLAILSPGTGVLEGMALLLLAVVAWEVYNLAFNLWSLIFLLVGGALFVLALRRPSQPIILMLSILALVVGSAFLFPSDAWWKPAVNPFLALLVSGLMTGFFWVMTHKIIDARRAPPHQNLEALIGGIGEAKTMIHDEGTVQIGSELWSARSPGKIRSGEKVRVVGRNGFILEVAPIQPANEQEDS